MKIKRAVLITLITTLLATLTVFLVAILSRNVAEEAMTNITIGQTTSSLEAKKFINEISVENNDEQSQNEQSLGCGVVGGKCSMAEIAKRNNKAECWVIYRGEYYDVTSYIKDHKGGTAVFNDSTCGKDIQVYLEGDASTVGRQNQHGTGAYKDLEKLKVGTVEN